MLTYKAISWISTKKIYYERKIDFFYLQKKKKKVSHKKQEMQMFAHNYGYTSAKVTNSVNSQMTT